MKRFKIVSGDNTSFRANGKYKIFYEEGKIIESIPNTIGIMCFDNIDSIQSFLEWDLSRDTVLKPPVEVTGDDSVHGKIYSVETIDEIKIPELITFSGHNDIDKYIKNIDSDIITNHMGDENTKFGLKHDGFTSIDLPDHCSVYLQKPSKGTICAKKIKLLELKYYIILK